MPFTFTPLELPEVVLVEPKVFGDARGFFAETYKRSEFEAAGIGAAFNQDNLSGSTRGVLRGLHYQADPMAQGKLVRAGRGEIFDVAVDIRKGSPRFGRWVGVVLSDQNRRMLWVPPGFAHGFVTLSDYAELVYKATNEYSPAHDCGIRWDDPAIGIKWPITAPALSAKDAALPGLDKAEIKFTYGG